MTTQNNEPKSVSLAWLFARINLGTYFTMLLFTFSHEYIDWNPLITEVLLFGGLILIGVSFVAGMTVFVLLPKSTSKDSKTRLTMHYLAVFIINSMVLGLVLLLWQARFDGLSFG